MILFVGNKLMCMAETPAFSEINSQSPREFTRKGALVSSAGRGKGGGSEKDGNSEGGGGDSE